jgi:DNA (cytosine-5)-methyltransferase 1
MNELTHLDLFSGIGGFALAARWNGFRTLAFCDNEPYAQAVLKKHWPDVPCHRDIREIQGNLYAGVTLLTGGFPCQPFSVAGKQRGKGDDRYLWPEMLRVIREARPAWIIGENVAGIVNMALDQVHTDVEAEGYEVESLIVPACGVDAPHRRDRVWIMADSKGGRMEGGWANREQVAQVSPSERVFGCNGSGEQWANWLPEPGVGRVAHGIPNRSHRIRGLGNAIVPQVAAEIVRCIRIVHEAAQKTKGEHT